MAKREKLPDHAIVVTEYAEFRELVQAFADGHYELMTIIGGPGLGKSEVLKRCMQVSLGGSGWTLIKGKHTPLALYRKLHQSRLLPVALDDLDGLFPNRANTAILKCVCDTQLVKRVEWGSEHSAFRAGDNALPRAFESISRVCIIANEWQALSKNLQALQDRGILVLFRPDTLEVHREVAGGRWFDAPEVFEFVGNHLFLMTRPSIRLYISAKNHRDSGLNWKDLLLRTIEREANAKLILVARLLADPTYDAMQAPEASREGAFKSLGGGSRATYHRHKQELLRLQNRLDFALAKDIVLQPPKVDPYQLAIADRRRQLEAERDGTGEPHVVGEQVAVDSSESNATASVELEPSDPVGELRARMREAIAEENYELAAELRNEIRRLETRKPQSDCDSDDCRN